MRPTALDSLNVIRMRDSDRDFIRKLSVDAFSEYTAAAGTHTVRMTEGELAVTLVATLAGEPVGFGIVSFEAPAATLLAIAVDPARRGLGVGRRLLAAAEQEALRRGARVMALATAEANVAALDLFLRAGYRMERRRFRYYARGQNAVNLRKRLVG